MKVFKSLENRGILLKGTTRKIISQNRKFLNFLRPLMPSGLPLMKSVHIPLAKSVLLPFVTKKLVEQLKIKQNNKKENFSECYLVL